MFEARTNMADAITESRELQAKFRWAFVSGSYITNPDTANDVDLVIPEWERPEGVLEANGFTRMNKEYGDSVVVPELNGTWRKGSLNVLVIRSDYAVAYKAALLHMTISPDQYQTREDRIALHQGFKQEITRWFKV